MKGYLEGVAKSKEGQWKHRLLRWGGILDLCGRKQEEVRRLTRLKLDSEELAEGGVGAFLGVGGYYETEVIRIREEITTLLEEKRWMDEVISSFSAEEQEFIYLRYEKGYSYDYIALKMYQSRSSCFRMQDRILKKLEEQEQDGTL